MSESLGMLELGNGHLHDCGRTLHAGLQRTQEERILAARSQRCLEALGLSIALTCGLERRLEQFARAPGITETFGDSRQSEQRLGLPDRRGVLVPTHHEQQRACLPDSQLGQITVIAGSPRRAGAAGADSARRCASGT